MLEELKKKFLERDRVLHIISKNGNFRAVIVRNSNTVKVAQQFHNLNNISAFFLAKTMTSATMISAFLKGEERVVVEVTSDGVISKIYAEALQVGECRGFVKLNSNLNNSNLNSNKIKITTLADFLGNGFFKISRILYNQAEPTVGIIPLQKGDISMDLAYYFAQSEQINSAVILDVDFDKNNLISCSGGILVQAMPGATVEEIETVENSILNIKNLCSEISLNSSLAEVLKNNLPFEFDIIKSIQVDFFCRCNLDNFKNRLLFLELAEIIDMKEKGHNELVCQYCNKNYNLSEKDFDEIIGQLKARQN